MHTVFAPLFAELQFRGWFPWPVALALGVLAAAAAAALYAREAGRLGVLPRALMAAVRGAVVLAVAFLLLRPVWVSDETGEKLRPVAVLVDVSRSMDSDDPRPDNDDQARAAIAFGLLDAEKGLPPAPVSSLVPQDQLPRRPKRVEVARAALLNPKIDLFRRLAKVGPLEVYTFGSERVGRDPAADDWLKTLSATEPRVSDQTALVRSAFELLNRDDAAAPAAIVVVTDGRENAGPQGLDDLARECARREIPLHVYGVGGSAVAQLRVGFGAGAGGDADVPTTLFVDDTAAVPVRYTVKGVAGGTAKIVLRYGDREVATKEEKFALTPDEARAGKTFATVMRFTPTKADADANRQEYSATVTLDAPAGRVAGTATRPARVVSRKLKVLVVDSLPRFDFKFLQRALLRDRRVEAQFFLTDGDRQAMRSGPPWVAEFSDKVVDGVLTLGRDEFRKFLFEFDLLVLGDVPGKFLTDDHKDVIAAFVRDNGGGLIQVAGRWHAPHDWAVDKARVDAENKRTEEENRARPAGQGKPLRVPLADVLPVEFKAVVSPPDLAPDLPDRPGGPAPFVPVPGPAAARTPVVALEDDPADNAELWGRPGPPPAAPPPRQLKPMYWYYPVTRVKAAADVFLTHPTAQIPGPDGGRPRPMPLLVGHHYGQGYVLFVGFDDTWRWRFNSGEKYFGRFWTQAVYVAGVPRIVGTRRVQVSSDTPAPVTGTSGAVYVRALDKDYRPLRAETIEGELVQLDADPKDKNRSVPVTFRKVPGSDGEYMATVDYQRVGQFRLTVDPKNRLDPERKDQAVLTFPVNYPENDERAPGPPDEAGMRRLARDSRGAGADAGFYREETLFKLPDEVKPRPSPVSGRVETLLWNEWALAALVGLLALEWFLRKFNGLS